ERVRDAREERPRASHRAQEGPYEHRVLIEPRSPGVRRFHGGWNPTRVYASPMTGVGHAFSRVQAEPWRSRADWRLRVDHARFRYLGGLVALVALYYGAAQLGYALGFAGPVASIVWLPVGVGISFLYLFGLEFWPGVVIGDLLSNDYMALPFGSALGQTCGNLLEVVVATVLIHRLVRRGPPLATAGGVGRV